MIVFLLAATHEDITSTCNNCGGNNAKCYAVVVNRQLNVVHKMTPCQYGHLEQNKYCYQ